MGQGIAMTRWGLLALMLTLTACGSDPTANEGLALARAVLAKAPQQPSAGPAPAEIGRAAIDQGGNPLLRVRLDRTAAVALLGKLSEGAGVVSWATVDGLTLHLRQGVVLASRGFGNDLMSALVPSPAQLASGEGHERQHFYLFGGEQEVRRTYTCTMSDIGRETIVIVELAYSVTHRIEACSADGQSFQNHFWFDGRGKIRQSTQWISPDVGILELQDLVR